MQASSISFQTGAAGGNRSSLFYFPLIRQKEVEARLIFGGKEQAHLPRKSSRSESHARNDHRSREEMPSDVPRRIERLRAVRRGGWQPQLPAPGNLTEHVFGHRVQVFNFLRETIEKLFGHLNRAVVPHVPIGDQPDVQGAHRGNGYGQGRLVRRKCERYVQPRDEADADELLAKFDDFGDLPQFTTVRGVSPERAAYTLESGFAISFRMAHLHNKVGVGRV